ncbi:MAG: peptidoglycan DD-metalloendopeptidase family protein [Epulopiscium sp.]|nr:peptidoglycan DD-metalloendopeptidase family protein [Candidatus Epulonipiscium sp.]
MRSKIQKRLRSMIVIFIFMMATTVLGNTTKNLNDAKKQQQKLQENLKQTQQELKNNEVKQQAMSNEIKALDQEISKVENKIEQLEQSVKETEEEIAQKEAELAIAEEKEVKQYETLKKRIKYMYEKGQVGYLEVLFQSENLTDFLSRLEYIKKIMNYDQNVLTQMQEIREDIVLQKANIQEKKEQLVSLKKETLAQRNAMEEKKKRKGAELATVRVDAEKQKKQLEELEGSIKQVGDEIKRLTALSNRVYGGGKLEWPLPGRSRISSGYGYRTDPISGKKNTFHSGIDIPAPTGTKVIAAGDGTVLQSRYIGGYGYTVIIDHGKDNGKTLSTLYAHNSKLLKKEGQTVKRGEGIALAGSTGYSTGPHVHFEVRLNGNHTNPIPYVKSQ